MVTVKVADDYIGAVLQGALDFLTNPFANRYLKRMGKKFVTLITQSNSRVNDYFAVSGFHYTGETPDSQGFSTQDLNSHILSLKIAGLLPASQKSTGVAVSVVQIRDLSAKCNIMHFILWYFGYQAQDGCVTIDFA
jgi:hypothetical protein